MKLRRTVGLMVALAGLAGSTIALDTANAQEPKTKPKTTPADDKKAPAKAKAGTIEIYEGKSGWRFRIKSGEDKTIAMPTKGYEKKEDCIKVLDEIKTILANAKPTEVKE